MSTRKQLNTLALIATVSTGVALLGGCLTVDIGGGTRLSGTATNALTSTGVAGVSVTLSPAVDNLDIVTGDDGTYSATVPPGVYSVTFEGDHFVAATESVSVIGGATSTLDVALMPVAAVVVTTSVDGHAAPGETVTASATVAVLDGSTVQSYAWSQANSVDVALSGATSATATVTLPNVAAYKAELLHVLAEPPIGEDQLPENVPVPEGEFPGGLQDRFYIVGLNPFSLEEAALVGLTVEVTTTSGTYEAEAEVHAALPWKPALGIRNVPVDVPVLLHGRSHVDEDGNGMNDETGADVTTYNWSLNRPGGSSAALVDATTQDPYFTPDASGVYTVTVTDTTRAPGNEVVTLEIYAGTWQGAISGQDAAGLPLAESCTVCHNGTIAGDTFTEWRQTGHAEIFEDSLNTSTHYGENCFVCHTVGYDPDADNGGIDEAADYADFLAAGLLNVPGDNWTTVLAEFPETAQLGNIQCENCHGPQGGGAHMDTEARMSLSSDVCSTCHGEPLRHGRYQQWQLSGHANYELAVDESESGSCARCHTANGFLAWLPVLLDDDPATDPLDSVAVTWTADEAHPQTCVVCHDPHDIGTTTGAGTNATVRITDDTPMLTAGFAALGVGRGAICMTCHNSRRGLRNDDTFDQFFGTAEAARAPHGSAQTDVLMGENAYFVEVGIRGSHSFVEDTCVRCHMVSTPPPDILSYNLGGTNHTFFAAPDICADCHGEFETADTLIVAYEASANELKGLIEDAIATLIEEQLDAGNTVSLNGEATITTIAAVDSIEFGESHGRQAITVTFTNGEAFGPHRINDVAVLDGAATDLGMLYDFADARLVKAGWNWVLTHNDGSSGVHNPPFVFQALDAAIDSLIALADG